MNPLKELGKAGQSVWLDYIQRSLIEKGELKRLIENDGVGGVTSNPSIFEKAVNGSRDYEEFLNGLQGERLDAKGIYERLVIRDVRDAADILKPVYEQTSGRDGFVSLEVSPHLAYDTEGTVNEARRLWEAVGRGNLMIKVPGTEEGMPAVELLISEGININVTLLFAREAYEKAAQAYISGLEKGVLKGNDPRRCSSVASFFVSRIDSEVDNAIQDKLKADPNESAILRGMLGRVAISNAKLAYKRYKEIFSGERWNALGLQGARTQRVLWASTSTKNKAYKDVLYIEELIGKDTVNTIPPATMDAFRDHGNVRATLEEDVEAAVETMALLEDSGISMGEVTAALLERGVVLFEEAFDKLLDAIVKKCGKS